MAGLLDSSVWYDLARQTSWTPSYSYVTKDGDTHNIVPHDTSARYMVRAQPAALPAVRGRVLRCFEAGAWATGCELELIGSDKPYAEMRSESLLVDLYRNAEAAGRHFAGEHHDGPTQCSGSTDMGNVSLEVPSLHPFIGLDTRGAVNHQAEFAAACATPAADQMVLDGATLLAWTAIDAASNARVRQSLMWRLS